MIIGKPTRFGSGIEIYGDENDLRELHRFVSGIQDNPAISVYMQDFSLGLAYECRKSYEGFRLKMPASIYYNNVEYVGFRFLWINFLITIRILRWSLSFRPSTPLDQSLMYRLEHAALSALQAYNNNLADEIWNYLLHLPIFAKGYPLVMIEIANNEFMSKRNGKERFNSLLPLLRSLHPLSEDYQVVFKHLQESAKRHDCSINDLKIPESDSGNFKW